MSHVCLFMFLDHHKQTLDSISGYLYAYGLNDEKYVQDKLDW